MPKTIRQRVSFRAAAAPLFDIYLSSRKHAAATGATAVMSEPWAGGSWPMPGGFVGETLRSCPSA